MGGAARNGRWPMTDFERFTRKIDTSGECWRWRDSLRHNDGYGSFYLKPKCQPAHRVAYQMFVGPIPLGLHIDHLCRNRACVRPDHLEAVTNAENVMRGIGFGPRNKRKTQCARGHGFTPDNTYVDPIGKRHCLECSKLYMRRRRASGRR